MRRIGNVLMAAGAVVGVTTGLAVLGDVHIPGVGSWLLAVAVAKLGFIAAFTLIAAGAAATRMAGRQESKSRDVSLPQAPGNEHQRELPAAGLPDAQLRRREPIPQERPRGRG